MRRLFVFIPLMLGCIAVSFAQDGIAFEKEGAWKQILAKAKAENKLVFLDAYTTWCGPCKKMSRDVFPSEEVGTYYNANFINVKMDMEKGEGISIAQQYEVRAYPTLLYVNGDGEMVHRSTGYAEVDEFINIGKAAKDPTKQLATQVKRYESGDKSPQFLKEYAQTRFDQYDGSHHDIAVEYLGTQKNWDTEDNRAFLFQYIDRADGSIFDYFLKHKDTWVKTYGETGYNRKLGQLINSKMADLENPNLLTEVNDLFMKMNPASAAQNSARFKMQYYGGRQEWSAFAQATDDYFGKYKAESWDQYNEAAWTMYEVTEDAGLLKKAIGWAKKSIKMEKNYYNLDTLAALYHKAGNNKKAVKTAKKAIALGKKNGDDVSGTESLIETIKG